MYGNWKKNKHSHGIKEGEHLIQYFKFHIYVGNTTGNAVWHLQPILQLVCLALVKY